MTPPDPQLDFRRRRRSRLQTSIVVVVLAWTFCYNVLIKQQGVVNGFFKVLDTISDDFVNGTLLTIAIGTAIILVFSVTKLFSQIIANIYSFSILEGLVFDDLRQGRIRGFFDKLIHFQEQPRPNHSVPDRLASVLMSLSVLYLMSWFYVIVFSEVLFFVSWSAGVNLEINERTCLMMPALSLAIPFSARAMAYFRYPYAQEYADFMPAAMFVFLVVTALGLIFETKTQEFYFGRVSSEQLLPLFFNNGAFLAFIPVFFESGIWFVELNRANKRDSADALSDTTTTSSAASTNGELADDASVDSPGNRPIDPLPADT